MPFRLIVDGPADGAVNMAVDEALLDSVARGGITTVRFYRFTAPTLTFGYGQQREQICNETACRRLGIDRIRRITGGRALLHHDELTYSVTGARPAGSPRTHYGLVNGAIRNALTNLGVPVDAPGNPSKSSTAASAPNQSSCLSVHTGHELTAEGQKLVASAMRLRRNGFLVHGSILWDVDRTLWKNVFALPDASTLRAVGIRELATPDFGEAELIEALTYSFEILFGVREEHASLTAREVERVARLEEKYRSEGWTNRVRRRIHLVDNQKAVW